MAPDITIRNVVVTASAGRPIDLSRLARGVDGADFAPRRFPSVVVRPRGLRCSVSVFGTGSMVCTGAPSEETAGLGVRTALSLMRGCGIDVPAAVMCAVRNVVATAYMRGRISVPVAARSLPRSMYEPGMFPGIVHRMVDPRCTMLLFASGKAVCAGAGSVDTARRALCEMHATLLRGGMLAYDHTSR